MLVLLSPAKRLTPPPAAAPLQQTSPKLMGKAVVLAQVCQKIDAEGFATLMSLSDNLANGVERMFTAFTPTQTPANARQAVLSFAGDVYVELDPNSLTTEDLNWAQDHLAILSGLYGLLKPLDLIQPYRLEMGTKLKTSAGANLYHYWGDTITQVLNERSHDVIVNLASAEYFKSVKLKGLTARVVTPKFLELKDGKSRVISFYAKRARGMMARWIVQNRLTDPTALRSFNEAGYRYDEAASTDVSLVFSRPQPTPVKGQ